MTAGRKAAQTFNAQPPTLNAQVVRGSYERERVAVVQMRRLDHSLTLVATRFGGER